MMTWSSFPETRHDAAKGFGQMTDADDEADHPGVKLIGRWHDLVAVGGWLICESDDISAVQSWALNWNGVLNMDVTPVVDDNEAKTMLKRKWNL
tara:strand:+ start:231 stop:512 length:282 start_codon:yes stop_codon:yes gene_type:complete